MEEKRFFCNCAVLIDDSGIDNFIHERQLKTSRFAKKIKVFVTVEEAIRELLSDEVLPDYIFLDIHMPFMNGFEFLDELTSKFSRLNSIKIIILTASVHPIDKLKAEKYPQIVSWLGKPLDQKQLLDVKMNTVKQKS